VTLELPAALSHLPPHEQVAQLQRLRHLVRYAWDCGDPDCDGQPHERYPRRHARAKQKPPPGDWWAWFLMYGRGGGKTRSAAEFVKKRMLREPGHRVAIIERTFALGRDVCVEGESGLLGNRPDEGVIPPEFVKHWNRSHGVLELVNGSRAKIFGTDTKADAEKTRGDQYHTAWIEEAAAQRFGKLAWDIVTFAVRLGDDPRVVITSTPKPTRFVRGLANDPDVVLVDGVSTFDNAENLPDRYLQRLKSKYQGTTLGLQELEGRILDASQGALWTYGIIKHRPEAPALARIVVAIDPAGTAHATSDLTGIIVAGTDGHNFWVLADYSGRYSPEGWRVAAWKAFDLWEADNFVAEVNYGGDMVASNLRAGDRRAVIHIVHATRGKERRAAPVVSLYEQGRGYHLQAGTEPPGAELPSLDDDDQAFGLDELEVEMTTWIPPGQFNEEGDPIPPSDDSPNRVDAKVWAAYDLMLEKPVTQQRMRYHDDD
jgi:phage terminase large subunit-like protein